jgi:hypothetical protein
VINAGVKVNTTYAQQMAQNFSSLTTNTYEFSLGLPPPLSGNTEAWLQQSVNTTLMDPLQYSLLNISQLFSVDFTEDSALNARYAPNKKTNQFFLLFFCYFYLFLLLFLLFLFLQSFRYQSVDEALSVYCPLHLIPTGIVTSCDAPPIPPPPPTNYGYGALACGTRNGRTDCYYDWAAVFNGASNIEAQEVVLDFCPSCTIVVWIIFYLSITIVLYQFFLLYYQFLLLYYQFLLLYNQFLLLYFLLFFLTFCPKLQNPFILSQIFGYIRVFYHPIINNLQHINVWRVKASWVYKQQMF